MQKVNSRQIAALFFILIYLGFVLTLTLFIHNYYTYGRSSNLLLFSSIRLMLRSGNWFLISKNVFGNVALFLPIGLLFPLILKRKDYYGLTLLFGFSFSFLIEICQYRFAARIFDIDDVFLNVLGTLFGRLLLTVIRFLFGHCIIFYTRHH
ncbi:MAG: VanZ family protein [Sporolactobacillus sp.]